MTGELDLEPAWLCLGVVGAEWFLLVPGRPGELTPPYDLRWGAYPGPGTLSLEMLDVLGRVEVSPVLLAGLGLLLVTGLCRGVLLPCPPSPPQILTPRDRLGPARPVTGLLTLSRLLLVPAILVVDLARKLFI